MNYILHNSKDAAKAIYDIGQADKDFGFSDFLWFITTLVDAIEKRLSTTLRYNVPTAKGLEEIKVIINEAELSFEKNKPFPTTLCIRYTDTSTMSTHEETYLFNSRFVEENSMSIPGTFMKYYIKDTEHNVLVGFIFNYK